MNKLTLPKNPHKGLKIFCKRCNEDNSKCKHSESQVYRVRVHVPGTKNTVKTKVLEAVDYDDAVVEAIAFKKGLSANNFSNVELTSDEGNDYSIVDAFVTYNQYLDGVSSYAHLKKNIGKGYKEELIRYCTFFCRNLNKTKDITKSRIKDINREDVSSFYSWAEKHYVEKTFNKCMAAVKGFFEFLINVEEIEMKNPLRVYERKVVVNPVVDVVTKEEFDLILEAVDNLCPMLQLGGKGERKNMYRPYLKDAYRLFLYTGCRREELVRLRWSDIFETDENVKLLMVENLKVQRIKKRQSVIKPVPITSELMNLLMEMGYKEKYTTNEYILHPDRDLGLQSLMDLLSKSFTHYWKSTGVNRSHSLRTLRKTYLTWVNKVMGNETKILSSHSTDEVLKKYYLDSKVLSAVEKGALEIKIFG
jgi:integrase